MSIFIRNLLFYFTIWLSRALVIQISSQLQVRKINTPLLTVMAMFRRELLGEIRSLREEREAAAEQPDAAAVDPAQMDELKGLRQKKDELELRMSSLQETRKELMSQLEGLMSILKVRFLPLIIISSE